MATIDILPKIKFIFHSQEKYYPCSFEYFNQNSTLYDVTNKVDIGKKTLQELSTIDCIGNRDNYILKINKNEDIKKGFYNKISDIPVYYYIRKYPNNPNTYISLALFYIYNGPYNILNIEKSGYHYGDLEHITFEYDPSNTLKRVYFGAHGDGDGKWIDYKDLEMENGFLNVYIAVNGHGFYYKSGTYFRTYGLANDETDSKGLTFIPQIFVSLDNEDRSKNGLAYFCGLLGDEIGTSSFITKGWFKNIDKQENPPPLIDNNKYLIIKYTILIIILSILYYINKISYDKFGIISPIIFIIVVIILYFYVKNLIKKLGT